jgi:hypothetical protein
VISIIVGSTRPGRNGGQVAGWGREVATWHAGDEAAFDVLDLKEFGLPLLDELVPALVAPGSHPHTVRWAQRAGSLVAGAFRWERACAWRPPGDGHADGWRCPPRPSSEPAACCCSCAAAPESSTI